MRSFDLYAPDMHTQQTPMVSAAQRVKQESEPCIAHCGKGQVLVVYMPTANLYNIAEGDAEISGLM